MDGSVSKGPATISALTETIRRQHLGHSRTPSSGAQHRDHCYSPYTVRLNRTLWKVSSHNICNLVTFNCYWKWIWLDVIYKIINLPPKVIGYYYSGWGWGGALNFVRQLCSTLTRRSGAVLTKAWKIGSPEQWKNKKKTSRTNILENFKLIRDIYELPVHLIF